MVDQEAKFKKGSPSRDHGCGIYRYQDWGLTNLTTIVPGPIPTTYINVLELQATWLGLQDFSQRVEIARVALMNENMFMVFYLRIRCGGGGR